MKIEFIKYTIVCDNCKTDMFEDDTDFDSVDENCIDDEVKDRKWISNNENEHYCPKYFKMIGGNPYINLYRKI